MKLYNQSLSISPTDLSYFLSCRHRAAKELGHTCGARKRPVRSSAVIDTLVEMGIQHEAQYVRSLGESGMSVLDLNDVKNQELSVQRTLEGMKAGVGAIVQAGLAADGWHGRPDVLLKVQKKSPILGEWSYEPADAKLARETRGGTIIQLGVYCHLLESIQGCLPEKFHVVSPGSDGQVTRTYRFHDYAAYFRFIKARFEDSLPIGFEKLETIHEPEPVEHCMVCPWWGQCRDWWVETDHLSLVAGISRLQRQELLAQGISTLEKLAKAGVPFPFKPSRGSISSYERVRDQAKVQLQSREEKRILYELIPPPVASDDSEYEPMGLARLPEPSPGDVFLDLEGDSLASDGGRDYLFGLVTLEKDGTEKYQGWWAKKPAEERAAFETTVDYLMDRLEAFPGMHIYHYAPYETTAFKRLTGRYATREQDVDRLLRGLRFVDLYAVVRQGVRVGVERYSIKELEPLYGFQRQIDLRDASRALAKIEQALELGRQDLATKELCDVVEGYNKDDCVSTRRLRDWLEERRSELLETGAILERSEQPPDEAPEALDMRAQAVKEIRSRLLAGVPDDPSERSVDQHARFQLAFMLDWHRREAKSGWWEYFRLLSLPEEELFEERKAVSQLTFQQELGKRKKSVIHRYHYPPQDFDIEPGGQPRTLDGKFFGDVIANDPEAGILDIKVGPSKKDKRPSALIIHSNVGTRAHEDALLELGRRAAHAGGVAALPKGTHRALLLRETPRLFSGSFAPPHRDGDSTVTEYAVGIVTELDRTILALQGPPGAGKTFTGARMVMAAVKAGLKIGVTATSHKVINNLLSAVREAAAEADSNVRIGQKASSDPTSRPAVPGATLFTSYPHVQKALSDGTIDVVGGTAWLWARPEFEQSVDILFVDEAGQFSLANALAIAGSARSLVLLGDPQQLEQPSKGTHPDGAGLSALQHILGEADTMPADKGLFLPVTWRLAPPICAFTSELFYAGQLQAKDGLQKQELIDGPFPGQGLWLCEVEHKGNTSSSTEEAAEVARLVRDLLCPSVRWRDEGDSEHQITARDIRIVAPFNAQVHKIREHLSKLALPEVPVGTVDKFQGQEAPVAIYSMACSTPEEAPRGMEFLYSLNRLNVATSRARCAAVVVASPRLFEPDCQSPRQMKLANALCRFREMARTAGGAKEFEAARPRTPTVSTEPPSVGKERALKGSEKRWISVTRSEFEHERLAFKQLQDALGSEVLRAWSNFEFFTDRGNIYEVDLLLLTVHGFYLVEVKSWRGKIRGDQRHWFLDSGTPVTNPLFLADRKAKVLAGMLRSKPAFRRDHLRVPFLEARLYLSHTNNTPDIPPHVAQSIIVSGQEKRFLENSGTTIDLSTEKAIVKAMADLGLSGRSREVRFGSWKMGKLLAEDEATQDNLGIHYLDANRTCRLRIYPLPQKADEEAQERVKRAADREFRMLSAVNHRSLQKPDDLLASSHGYALVYPYDPSLASLDQFVAEQQDRLDVWTRLRLLREIAEALDTAHQANLLHRALAPQNILVSPSGEDIKILNWGTGVQTGASLGTSHFSEWVSQDVSAYVAPEAWTDPKMAGTYSDIFSLGAVAFTLFSGLPPAANQMELKTQLGNGGLRLSGVSDGVVAALDDLIADCTDPDPDNRPLMVEDFLERLDEVEREIQRPEPLAEEQPDPLKAQNGETLANGDKLVKRLGSGAISVALLVERDGEQSVLKIARDAEAERRLEEEAEVLSRLSHPRIVGFQHREQIGDRLALRLDFVSEDSVASELAANGRYEPEFLQRYGADLLDAVIYLEKSGIAHRDIKPSNMGTTTGKAKKERHLIVYDFSLSKAASENLKAGTTAYLDPFLALRGRWDTAAERYGVAVTLHQMASGVLPTWGKGTSDPATDKQAELQLAAGNFDPHLRPELIRFFQRALHRDVSERFDNAEIMKTCWEKIFSSATSTGHSSGSIDPAAARPDTPVSALALSPSALSALDGFEVATAKAFANLSRQELNLRKGIGGKTRRELLDFQAQLAEALGGTHTRVELEGKGLDAILDSLVDDDPAGPGDNRDFRLTWLDEEPTDVLVKLLKTKGRRKKKPEDVYDIQSSLRIRWKGNDGLLQIRESVNRYLENLGGVASERELTQRLLSEIASAQSETEARWRLGRRLLVAATLVERESNPRWFYARPHGPGLFAHSAEGLEFGRSLGKAADRLVSPDSFPVAPPRALDYLTDEVGNWDPPLDPARLIRLAASFSERAEVSARGELYTRGMEPVVALRAAAGVFLATHEIDVTGIKARVKSRYPESADLPGRLELGKLLTQCGIDLRWEDDKIAFCRPERGFSTTSSSYLSLPGDQDPEELPLQLRQFVDRLERYDERGGFLVLSVNWKYALRAQHRLVRHFSGWKCVNVERLMIRAMKSFCKEKRIEWDVVLGADVDPQHSHWKRLLKVAQAGLDALQKELTEPGGKYLLVNLGLLARYEGMKLLETWRDKAAMPGQPKLVVLLVPSVEPEALPTIGGKPIPTISSGQRMAVARGWVELSEDRLKKLTGV